MQDGERREEGKGEESDGRARESEGERAGLGGWEEALYPLGMWSHLSTHPAVLDTASISLELSDTNIHK